LHSLPVSYGIPNGGDVELWITYLSAHNPSREKSGLSLLNQEKTLSLQSLSRGRPLVTPDTSFRHIPLVPSLCFSSVQSFEQRRGLLSADIEQACNTVHTRTLRYRNAQGRAARC
jgi:hypothetical protein